MFGLFRRKSPPDEPKDDEPKEPAKSSLETAREVWAGRVEVGNHFEYLGRQCVVSGTVKFMTNIVICWAPYPMYRPALRYEYADENGVIREGELPMKIAERIFPPKDEE